MFTEDNENKLENLGNEQSENQTDVVLAEESLNEEDSTLGIDMSKLDKKSMEILEDTDESDYKFKLHDFEGPLDLLVHLIKITKIDIRDIFVSTITEQYLKYMEDIETIDVEKASEFINMAATLLELKSKHLLPKPVDDNGEDDAEENFFRMIEEYKLIKEETIKLQATENVNSFYKAPDSTVGEFKYELPDTLSIDALVSAFSNLMQKMAIKAEVVQEKKIVKDKFTVAQKIAQIKDMLIAKEKFNFTELFEEEHTKSEIINTFLALLELLKRQYIKVSQNELFDDIEIVRNEDVSERLTEDEVITYDGED